MIRVLGEGKGEREAGPQLVRHILQDYLSEYLIVPNSKAYSTHGKGDLIKSFEILIRYLNSQDDCEGILVLVDSDDECAAILAKDLAARAKVISHVPVVVVCPVEEFENWFLCSVESICPSESLGSLAGSWDDCERVSNPKDLLNSCLPGGYLSTLDQARLVWKIQLDITLQRSRSLRRLVHAIQQLVASINTGTLVFTP